MSMYDTIHGEQIKCFGWHTYVTGPIIENQKLDFHGGNLRDFEIGSPVPYRSLSYNYTPDFIILDTSPIDETLAFILHVIKNGRLKTTISVTKEYQAAYKFNPQDEHPNINQYFQNNSKVIGYYGNPTLKIKSIDDVHRYYASILKLRNDINDATKTSQSLWKEYRQLCKTLRDINRKSPEYAERKAAIQKNRLEFHKAKQAEKPNTDALQNAFAVQWCHNEPYAESITLGQWIESGQWLLQHDKKFPGAYKKFCKDFKLRFPVLHDSMIDDYHQWHESTPIERQEIDSLIYKFHHSL